MIDLHGMDGKFVIGSASPDPEFVIDADGAVCHADDGDFDLAEISLDFSGWLLGLF